MWKGRDIITMREFSRGDMEEVLALSEKMEKVSRGKGQLPLLKGKVLATLFFEPSTRTMFSFQTAMLRLGGTIIGTAEPKSTSAAKGETLWDSIKLVHECSDAIVMRHPNEGSARRGAESSDVPFINAGDGSNQHPTQALLDLYTIKQQKKKIDGLNVLLLGDLKYGRTVHSLAYALSQFEDVTITLHSPAQLRFPAWMYAELKESVKIREIPSLDLSQADVVYATRIQKERFADPTEYAQSAYILDAEKVAAMKEDAIIMHPLPRVDEIATEVDGDKRAKYFRQEANGIAVRMALLSLVMTGR